MITGSTTICEGDNTDITFNLAGSVVGTYDVSYSDGSSTFNLFGISDGHMVSVSPTSTTTYTLIYVTDGNVPLCNGTVDPTSVVISVDPLPVAILSGGSTICNDGSTSNLTVTITTGVGPTYDVTIDNGIGVVTITSGVPFPVMPVVTTTYSIVDITDNGTGCFVAEPSGNISGNATVIVNELPTADIISSDVVLCDISPATMADIEVSLTG